MKKKILFMGLLVLVSSFYSFAFEADWEDISGGNTNVKAVLVNPDNPRMIYLGSEKGVFRSTDNLDSWENSLLTRGQNKRINFLLFQPQNKNSLYAASGAGLFYSSNGGENWKRIFKGKSYWEAECNVVAVIKGKIYLGTSAGLFFSDNRGQIWHKSGGKLANTKILSIAYSPDTIYVLSVVGLFRSSDQGQSWERIFVNHNGEPINEEEPVDEESQDDRLILRYVSADPVNPNLLYLATSRGVYSSKDKGQVWEPLPDYGLLSQDVYFILVSPSSQVYAIAKNGIFEYKGSRWQEQSLNLSVSQINYLDLDRQGNLYAATDKGLFKSSQKYSKDINQGEALNFYSKDEPSINEIQRIAIKYAEVDAEKIKQWRSQAAKKAWLPQFNAGVNRNVTDLWHWESGSTTKSDDDVLRKGKDGIEWDVNLSWDLADLIFNDDQTSIDARSRLMVQLRDDILDEVNKLYFERLRVKMELNNLAIEDIRKRSEKELHLQELTASLDALTGGYFSQKLKQNKPDPTS